VDTRAVAEQVQRSKPEQQGSELEQKQNSKNGRNLSEPGQYFRILIKIYQIFLTTGIIVITILIPYVTLLKMFCTGNKYGSIYASLALFPMTIHTIGNTVSMIYFIKPYKRFIMKTLALTLIHNVSLLFGESFGKSFFKTPFIIFPIAFR
jgi:hypothetical protein